MATDNGYFSSFVPARGTVGRPSGGLAILCKQAVPQQRMEEGHHWKLGGGLITSCPMKEATCVQCVWLRLH
eukprot:2912886-Amphidinium_carterae.1